MAGGSALIFAASASVLSPFAMAALGFVGLGEAFCIKFYKYVCMYRVIEKEGQKLQGYYAT